MYGRTDTMCENNAYLSVEAWWVKNAKCATKLCFQYLKFKWGTKLGLAVDPSYALDNNALSCRV